MQMPVRYSAAFAVVSSLFVLPALSAQTFTFGPPKVVATNTGTPLPLDLNGDGKTDLFMSEPGSLGGVHLGDGSGSFAATFVPVHAAGLPNELQSSPNFIDVNGDGKADMVFMYGGFYAPGEPYDYQVFAVALGDGHGNFTTTADFTLDYGPGSSFVQETSTTTASWISRLLSRLLRLPDWRCE